MKLRVDFEVDFVMATTNLAAAATGQAGAMNYQQLTASPLAWGTVYWAKKERMVPLFYPGDVLNFPLLKKFKAAQAVLAVDLAIDAPAVLAMVDLWQQYKNADSEEACWALRDQLLAKMHQWARQGKTSLNLVAAAAIQFLELPPGALRQGPVDFTPPAFLSSPVFLQLAQIDVQLLRRSFLLASLVTYFALGLGFTDYNYLQDLYRAALAAHWGLKEGNSFLVLRALAAEQAQSGRGIAALQDHAPPPTDETTAAATASPWAKAWDSFFTYPQQSVRLLQQAAPYLRQNDVLAAVAAQQEGNLEGGMPQGLCFWELDDAEKLMAVFNHLLPFTPHRYHPGDFTTLLKPLFALSSSSSSTSSSFWSAVDR
ncbi:MAG: hypothetical protein J6Y94_00145, partial [Bacteriovoracaceae bacterium]|nr:hypothetical protein [Bacteriovoracaceae bacterium]